MGCKVSDYGTRGGVTLIATKASGAAFSTTETWYTDLEKYDLIAIYAADYNSSYGYAYLNGIFPPDKLKADLKHQGIFRTLAFIEQGNGKFYIYIDGTNKFYTTSGAPIYIYGIKLGSTKP